MTVTNAAGETIGTGTVNDDGTFTIGLDPAQTDGGDLDVTLTDAAGNVSDPAATSAPDLISPDAPTDMAVADDGTVLTGRGEPGTTVTVTDAAGETIGTGTVNANGTFSIGLSLHRLTAANSTLPSPMPQAMSLIRRRPLRRT